MRHINSEKLVEYILGESEVELSGSVTSKSGQVLEQHLTQCSQCAGLKNEIELFVHQLQADAASEPAPELVHWAVELFQPLLQSPHSGKLRKLIASLVFDTFAQPLQAGVRGVAAPSRQLLFRAGDVDVDVKIESIEADNRISMAGQVLSPAEVFYDSAPVKLESHGKVQFQTTTNDFGEFSFDEVPKDTYHLSVDLPEGQITLLCVHRGIS